MESIKIVQDLKTQINCFEIQPNFSHIVILCIGTNKLIGDCVGPMVGEKLSKIFKNNDNIKIYGNMKSNVNLKNANQIMKQISKKYEKPFVIIVDAALGKQEMIGTILVNKGDILIGNSLGSSIYCKANINIKCVVGKYQNSIIENFETLRNVQIEDIKLISSKVVDGIYRVIK